MARFAWIVLLTVVAVRTAHAHEVLFEMPRVEASKLDKKLDGDALTGKAKLRLRLVGETKWLVDEEVALEVELDGDKPKAYKLKLAKNASFDLKRDVECHVMLPTAGGKWLGAVEITKARLVEVKTKKQGVRCSANGISLTKMDAAEFVWPEATQTMSVSLGYNVSVSAANAALKKAKDTAGQDGQATATLEIYDAKTQALLHERTMKVKMNALSDYVTNEDGGEAAWSVMPGTAVLYRATISTSKGLALIAEGAGTARLMASHHGQPSLTIDAKFTYVSPAKKLPKKGQWSSKKP